MGGGVEWSGVVVCFFSTVECVWFWHFGIIPPCFSPSLPFILGYFFGGMDGMSVSVSAGLLLVVFEYFCPASGVFGQRWELFDGYQ